MRTPTTFGIEYTFVPKFDMPYGWEDNRVERAINHLGSVGIDNAYNDGGALEVPSPVHKSINGARKFYERLIREIAPRRLVAQRVDVDHEGNEEYYGTGGGHIHIGLWKRDSGSNFGARRIVEKDYLLVRNIAVMVYNRPWLGWVFNEFLDDWNARAITKSKVLGNLLSKTGISQLPRGEMVYDYDECRHMPANRFKEAFRKIRRRLSKDTAINIANPDSDQWTVEFRFFDAPRSWPQAKEHIDFAMAIYRYAKEAADQGRWLEVGDMGVEAVKAFRSRDKVERAFRSTCRMLGLEWSRYEKYMENFDDRKQFGSLT